MPRAPSGKAVSLWVDTAPETSYPSLRGDVAVDVAVIGGGIAGLTAALLLKRSGVRVAVTEAGRVGTAVTGHTTGKVSSLQGLIYRRLRRSFGEEGARVYGEANEAAIDRIEALVEEENIECDFRRVANYTYAESERVLAHVKEEVTIAQRLGLPATYTDYPPLPFQVTGAVRFADQAQLHAARYLVGLAGAVDGEGSYVFEETRAHDIYADAPFTVSTGEGSVRAGATLIATNFPFLDRGLFSMRCHPHRSYLIAAGIGADESPDGTFISADEPLRSVMPHRSAGRSMLLVGGEGHRAEETIDTAERYDRLEAWARERFPVSSLEYRWSTQDAVPIDGVPYVGRLTPFSRNLYVATGFRKWGLSNGTVAGLILADRLLGRPNRWASVFDSNRVKPLAGARRFVTENARVGARFLRGRLAARGSALPELPRGEGRVLEVGGEKTAAYKDDRGEVHAVSAVCTHLGCLVEWNGGEKTWDCPCHGSRFDPEGHVLQGPAKEALPEVGVRRVGTQPLR